MSRRTLEAIVVPFDVDRADLPTARGARELLTRGLLAGSGAEVVTVVASATGDKSATVAAVVRGVARAVAAARARGSLPLVLSGGCLAALGAVGGIQAGGGEGSVRVVWIDAHGDFNTPASSASGYWDGMALAALCGRCLPEIGQAAGLRSVAAADVVHLAGRSFDPPEAAAFEALGLCLIPPAGIGAEACTRRLTTQQPGGPGRPGELGWLGGDLYVHIDLDGLDPLDAPAVGNPCAGGPPLVAVLAALAALPEPAAMTLATASFHDDGPRAEAKARRTLDTCRQLLAAALRLDAPASGLPPVDAAEG